MELDENHLTTNQKLESIINGKIDDEENEARFQKKKNHAKSQLRRTVLYGTGARTKIAKVKATPKYSMSPFALVDTTPNFPKERPLTSAVPPGAHQDMGRLVQFATSKSRADPDRIFFTSTSMDPSIVRMSQPPWYFGDNNKTKPADGSLAMAAARYGYRGSKDILQYHVSPVENPTHTRTAYTPKFLDGNEIINEWTPPIIGTVHQTINNYETPKLWPENSQYPSGVKCKRPPTSVAYNRETTVGETAHLRPQTSSSLSQLLSRSATERSSLIDYANMEVSGMLKSLPMLAQSTFDASWKERVRTESSGTLKQHLEKEVPPFEALKLVDESDTLRYSGTTAMIVRSQSNEELRFRLRLESNYSTLPYEARWKQVEFQFRGLSSRLKKDATMEGIIHEIGLVLRNDALQYGSPTTMKRSEFIASLQRISYFNVFKPNQLAMLYSAFDPKNKNAMRFIEYLVSLAVLDRPEVDPIAKLTYLWKVYTSYGCDLSPLSTALEVVASVCSKDEERVELERLFKEEFRPVAYRRSILSKSKSTAESSSKGFKSDLSIPPQYNITDLYLDSKTFVDTMKRCPLLLALYSSMLKERLDHLYASFASAAELEERKKKAEMKAAEFLPIVKRKAKKIDDQPWLKLMLPKSALSGKSGDGADGDSLASDVSSFLD